MSTPIIQLLGDNVVVGAVESEVTVADLRRQREYRFSDKKAHYACVRFTDPYTMCSPHMFEVS